MSPADKSDRQCELEECRLGMRSSDPAAIAYHFGRAAVFRELIAAKRPQLVSGVSGTKGSCPPRLR